MEGYSLVTLYHVTECSFTEGCMGDYGHVYSIDEYYQSEDDAMEHLSKLGGESYKDGSSVKLDRVVFAKKGDDYYELKKKRISVTTDIRY